MKKFAMHLLFFVGIYLAIKIFTEDYGFWIEMLLLMPLASWSILISEKVYGKEK